MNRFSFYLSYAFRNIQRGGRWTTLAVFAVAAGVATVVALRGLGLSIGETLVANVLIENKGDVRLIKDQRGESRNTLFGEAEDLFFFSEEEIAAVQDYVDERGGTLTMYTTGGNVQVVGIDNGVFGAGSLVATFLINPQTYPPNYDIIALEPEGVPLSELFTGGNEVVVSENMAQNQGLGLGDSVRVTRSDEEFTIVGIVSANNESSLNNPFTGFFGFAYMDIAVAQRALDSDLGVNNIAIAFDEPLTDAELPAVVNELERRGTLTTAVIRTETTQRLLERNATISQILGDFIVVMGLGALLIGGVGIMNTMLVMVRRRTNEIAALKTFGLKGRQIGWLFLAEGLLLGIIGSLIGGVIGVLLGGVVNQYGEVFLRQEIVWRIHPEALLYGFVLGLVITVIFGIAPILTALQVRPATILRPNDNAAPRLGLLQTLGLMILVTVLIGLVVGQIVSPTFGLSSSFNFATPYIAGVIGVAITLLILGLITLILWVLVWVIGKLPAFGWVDLRLALRNLSTHRLRTATTLLALSAGMFALSSITFVGEGTRQLLDVQLTRSFGGNVLVFPTTGIFATNDSIIQITDRALERALEDVPGVQHRTIISNYEPILLGVDGREVQGGDFSPEVFEEINPLDPASFAPFAWSNFSVWNSTNPDVYDNIFEIVEGRNLTPEDEGRLVLLGPEEVADPLDIGVGSILRYEVAGAILEYEVIGLYRAAGGFTSGAPVVPPGSVGNMVPRFPLFTFDIEREHAGQAVAELSALRTPPVIAVNVEFIDSFISRLIDQFAALPTVVGMLSLFAAAVIMANTVALATLERRRQIGILKAIGLKSWRVLYVMLIESSIVGLLSAVLGIGLSAVFLAIFSDLSGTPLPLPRESLVVSVALVIAAVIISVLSTFLSANVAVRERVMNVLRYE